MTQARRASLRVLMTTDAVGGVWTYALDLATALQPLGVEVTLAVFGPACEPEQRIAAARAGVAIVSASDTLDWTAATAGEAQAAATCLRALVDRLRPEIVQANSPTLLAGPRMGVGAVAVCHSDVKTWWAAVKADAPLPPDLAWRAALMADGYAAADALVAPTQAFAEATIAAYSLTAPIRAVWNGRRAMPAAAATAAPRGVFALAAGRLWDEGKGLATFDRAMARQPLPAYAAGPLTGPNGATVRLAQVHALGRLGDAELAGWLAAQPIFVSPALYEPFGLAVLEAAQAGCPLVLSDIATFRELWDGVALFTPPADADALATALDDLAGNEERRATLGAAACERAGRYTIEATAAAMLDVYASVLDSRRRRAVA